MKKYTDQGAEYTINDEGNSNNYNSYNSSVEPVFSRKDWGPEYTPEAVEARYREREARMRQELEFYNQLYERNGGRFVKFSFMDHLRSIFDSELRDKMERMEARASSDATDVRREVSRYDYFNRVEKDAMDILAGKHVENPYGHSWEAAQIIKFLNS